MKRKKKGSENKIVNLRMDRRGIKINEDVVVLENHLIVHRLLNRNTTKPDRWEPLEEVEDWDMEVDEWEWEVEEEE
jgi:hypothetical protein